MVINLMSISTGLDMYFTIVLELLVNHRNEEMDTYERMTTILIHEFSHFTNTKRIKMYVGQT